MTFLTKVLLIILFATVVIGEFVACRIFSPSLFPVNTSENNDAGRLVSFVNEAAFLLEKDGGSAYPLFLQSNSKWFSGTKYIFVYDMSGTGIVLPLSRNEEGINRMDLKDIKGIYPVRDMVNILKTRDSGWTEYFVVMPGENVARPRLLFFRKVKLGGTNKEVLLGSGIFYN